MEGESSKMPRFRCNKCGRYLKDGARYGLRHQKTKACRERYNAALDKATRIAQRSLERYNAALDKATRIAQRSLASCERRGLVPMPGAAYSAFPKYQRLVSGAGVEKGRIIRKYSRFVPRWQRDAWNVVYRVWDDLAAEVHAPGKDSSWRRECVSLVVIKACVRRRGLRDEIAAVALLGSNENIVKLLLERVPGVWGAMTKRWSP